MATTPSILRDIPPATGFAHHAASIRDVAAYDLTVSTALRQWLISNGIPKKDAASAKVDSLCRAYVFPVYLTSWRNRVNPLWASMDEPTAEAAPTASTTAAPGLTSEDVRQIAQDLDRGLLANVQTRAEEAAQALLSSSMPAMVRDLIAEALPPRAITIHRHDASSTTTIPLGLQHSHFPILLRAAQARDHRGLRLNIWLTGPTGSGKTSAAENVAKALGLSFASDGSLDADYKVLGFRDANGHIVSTAFLQAYTHGGVYVADEIDNWLPSALLSLNSALANGFVNTPSGMVRRHPDCLVIACANTWGLGATNDYVGRAKQDAATLDRFQPKIEWPIDPSLERAIANAQGGTIGTLWQSIVSVARDASRQQGLKVIISPRATISGLSLLTAGFTPADTMRMTFLAGLTEVQSEPLLRAIARTGLQEDLEEALRTAAQTPHAASPMECAA